MDTWWQIRVWEICALLSKRRKRENIRYPDRDVTRKAVDVAVNRMHWCTWLLMVMHFMDDDNDDISPSSCCKSTSGSTVSRFRTILCYIQSFIPCQTQQIQILFIAEVHDTLGHPLFFLKSGGIQSNAWRAILLESIQYVYIANICWMCILYCINVHSKYAVQKLKH